MSRLLAIACAAIAALGLAASQAHASDGGLVRIEPRPYYGAVVTLEHGVRVYRPLPSQQVMVINPNNAPVNVTFNRTVESSGAGAANADDGRGSGGGYGGFGGYGGGYAGFGYGGFGGFGHDGGKRFDKRRVPGVFEGRPHPNVRPRHKAAHR